MRIEFAKAIFRNDGNWRRFLAKPGQVCRSKTAHTMKIAQYVGPLYGLPPPFKESDGAQISVGANLPRKKGVKSSLLTPKNHRTKTGQPVCSGRPAAEKRFTT